MSFSADLDPARLSVLLDLRYPFAYLALHPAIAFAESRAIEINWLPITVPCLKPPTAERPGDGRGIRHRRHRAHAVAREIEIYAQTQGLTLREYYRNEAVEAANLGWLWLRDRFPGRLQPYLVELFRAYWSRELDAANAKQIVALIDSLGADGAAFFSWSGSDGPAVAAAVAKELQDQGLFQAPAYVFEDEVFYGRQHLPMIGWILDGRSGPIPI